MDIVLLVLCIIFLIIFLVWFFFGQERWSKLLNLIVDIIIILLCLGAFIVIFILKGEDIRSESLKNPIPEESTVTDGNPVPEERTVTDGNPITAE